MLQCRVCGHEQPLPKHCGQAMHLQEIAGRALLVCWMGPACGRQEVPVHCNQPMQVREERQAASV